MKIDLHCPETLIIFERFGILPPPFQELPMHFGPFIVRHRQGPGNQQLRFEVNLGHTNASLIFGQVTSRVPPHSHPHWEVFWFPKPRQVTLAGGPHTTKWMVTMPHQPHSIEEPCRVVALKVGPRS
jgi:hypothetical protein